MGNRRAYEEEANRYKATLNEATNKLFSEEMVVMRQQMHEGGRNWVRETNEKTSGRLDWLNDAKEKYLKKPQGS